MSASHFFSGINAPPSASATNFACLQCASTQWATTEPGAKIPFPEAGTLSNFRLRLDAAPGSGKQWVFTIRKNGVATGLTITIANSATTGADTTDSVSIAAGDQISVSCTPTGTPTQPNVVSWASSFESTTARKTVLLSSSYLSTAAGASTEYAYPSGSLGFSTTATNRDQIVTVAGTLTKITALLGTAPGSGKSFAITLYKNGVATALVATVSDTATTATGTGSVSVDVGDTIRVGCVPTSSPAATLVSFGITFEPTVDGNHMILAGNTNNSVNTVATSFEYLTSPSDVTWNATESNRFVIGTPTTLKTLRIVLSAAPTAGRSWVFTVRVNGVDTALTASIADAETTANVSADVEVAAGDTLTLKAVPSGGPTSSTMKFSLSAFNSVPTPPPDSSSQDNTVLLYCWPH
jgi:hypothetical protein